MTRATIAIGASIACSGVCLTVTGLPEAGSNARWFEVEAWEEALRLTTAGAWQPGTRINLERALKLGDELGGHIVSGHVDGMAEIVAREAVGEAVRFQLDAPAELAKFIASKGSVALDGTSLTVNTVAGSRFDVLLIDHSPAGDHVGRAPAPATRSISRSTRWPATRRGWPRPRLRHDPVWTGPPPRPKGRDAPPRPPTWFRDRDGRFRRPTPADRRGALL